MLNPRPHQESRWHDHLRSHPPPPSLVEAFVRRRSERGAAARSADVAIVGLGPAGLAALLGIVRHALRPVSVLIVDPAEHPGGDAYRRARPEHLLNARAASMSVDPEDATSFSHWLGRRRGRPAGEVADCYAPRRLYGEYLDDMRLQAISLANESGHHLHRIRRTVADIAATGPGWELQLDDGETRLARHVILATGCRARSPSASAVDRARIASSPWELDYDEAARLHGTGTAIVAGGGLSGVDAVLSLATAGWTGPIIVASPRGTLPTRHVATAAAPAARPAALTAGSARALFREFRQSVAADVRDGVDWRTRIQQLREELPALWPRLSPTTRRRLLRHAAGVWNRHRHRMAPAAASHVEDLCRSGQLRIEPWRVMAVVATPASLKVEVRDRHGALATVAADVFVAASGLDLAAEGDPLVARLLERGLVARSATGIGLAVEAVGTAVARGPRGRSLHALGAQLVGERLESTAVLELVAQARVASRELVALLGRSRPMDAPAGRAEPLFAAD